MIINQGENILKQKRSCSNCLKGTSMTVNNDILCREEGAVSADYVCSRHKFAPAQKPGKEMEYKCINCENFILSVSTSKEASSMGLCQLFSVRPFDGRQKKTCSKFVKRREREVG